MWLPIYVDVYSGFKTNERPTSCSAAYFKGHSAEGKTYLLRNDEAVDEWTLQSGFDGDELLTRPSIKLITVDADVIRRAEKENRILRALSSRRCRNSLRLASSRGNRQARAVRFRSERAGACPTCKHPLIKKTLIDRMAYAWVPRTKTDCSLRTPMIGCVFARFRGWRGMLRRESPFPRPSVTLQS
jgi:hypothetical protein